MRKLFIIIALVVTATQAPVALAQEDPGVPDLIETIVNLAPGEQVMTRVSLDEEAAACGGRSANFSTWDLRGSLEEEGGLLVASEIPASGGLSYVMLEMHVSIASGKMADGSDVRVTVINAVSVNGVGWGFIFVRTAVGDNALGQLVCTLPPLS